MPESSAILFKALQLFVGPMASGGGENRSPKMEGCCLGLAVTGWTAVAAKRSHAALCGLFGLWTGLAAMLAHAILYVFVLAPLINGLGQWHGAQNFRNTAYNWRILAWVTGGESLHNHHAHPRAAKFSVRRLEFDPSWAVIRLLAAVRQIVIIGTSVKLP